MFQRLRALRKNESGFTLVELLIVIVILGVLSGIVVFSVSQFNDKGKLSACKADLKSVEIATEAFYAQNQQYPKASTTTPGHWNDQLVPAYLKEAPTTTNGYTISLDAAGKVSSDMNGC
jgi:general secretion pathway protein G